MSEQELSAAEPAIAEPLFSLVLPAYNPGESLRHTWEHVVQFVSNQRRRWEVVYVCDGCKDGSDQRLMEWARECPHNIRVLRSPTNRGKGHAVRRGLLRARGDYRIFTDVDLAYPLDMVEAVADQLLEGNDVVIASRAHRESEVVHSEGLEQYLKRRKFKSNMFSMVARLLLRIRHRDPQAGLKGFSARAARMMLPYVKCQGFGFDCETLVACKYFGIPVRELPVRVIYQNSESTTRLTNLRSMLDELLAIRARWKQIARKGLDKSIFLTARHLEEARRYRKRRERRIARLMMAG
jgi:glycosyltransferase involved in cell wall biosynthesis